MNDETIKPESRKPYEPPKVMAINLRPEEAVLGHCKTSNSGGPASTMCVVCGSALGS
jgi:hypothetical protein